MQVTPFIRTIFTGLIKLIQPARAESTRAVTGRQCPHSGVEEDFLVRRPGPLTKVAVTREQKLSGRATNYRKTKVIQSYTRIWEYRGLMIPLSWVRPSQKMGDNTKMLPFGCPVMKVTKNWTISEKNGFLAKNCIFCPKFCIFLR